MTGTHGTSVQFLPFFAWDLIAKRKIQKMSDSTHELKQSFIVS